MVLLILILKLSSHLKKRCSTELSDTAYDVLTKEINNVNKVKKFIYINEYSELQQLMYKTTGVISPNKFVHGVQNLARI